MMTIMVGRYNDTNEHRVSTTTIDTDNPHKIKFAARGPIVPGMYRSFASRARSILLSMPVLTISWNGYRNAGKPTKSLSIRQDFTRTRSIILSISSI